MVSSGQILEQGGWGGRGSGMRRVGSEGRERQSRETKTWEDKRGGRGRKEKRDKERERKGTGERERYWAFKKASDKGSQLASFLILQTK